LRFIEVREVKDVKVLIEKFGAKIAKKSVVRCLKNAFGVRKTTIRCLKMMFF